MEENGVAQPCHGHDLQEFSGKPCSVETRAIACQGGRGGKATYSKKNLST